MTIVARLMVHGHFLNLVTIWLLLATVMILSIYDVYTTRPKLRHHYQLLELLAKTVGPIAYQVWVIWYIHRQWAKDLATEFQLIQSLPAIALLAHTLYQMYFLVVTNDLHQLEDHNRITVFIFINGAINAVMLVHLVTIIAIVHDPSIPLRQWVGFAHEFVYRVYALLRYYQLYSYTYNVQARADIMEIELDTDTGSSELVVTRNSHSFKRSNDTYN